MAQGRAGVRAGLEGNKHSGNVQKSDPGVNSLPALCGGPLTLPRVQQAPPGRATTRAAL